MSKATSPSASCQFESIRSALEGLPWLPPQIDGEQLPAVFSLPLTHSTAQSPRLWGRQLGHHSDLVEGLARFTVGFIPEKSDLLPSSPVYTYPPFSCSVLKPCFPSSPCFLTTGAGGQKEKGVFPYEAAVRTRDLSMLFLFSENNPIILCIPALFANLQLFWWHFHSQPVFWWSSSRNRT